MPALPHLANAVVSGVLTGTVYGLMALGLSAIFGVIRLVNFAHGELMTLAMYAAVVAFQGLALDPFLTMIAAAAVFAAFGYVLQRGFINRFIRRPEHTQMLLMIALAMIIGNAPAAGVRARRAQRPDQLPARFVRARAAAARQGPRLRGGRRGGGDGAAGRVLSPDPHRQGDPRLRRQSARRARRRPARRAPLRRDVRAGRRLRRGGRLRDGAAHRRDARARPRRTRCSPSSSSSWAASARWSARCSGGVVIGVSEALAGLLIAPSAKSMVSFGLLVVILLARPQGLMGAAATMTLSGQADRRARAAPAPRADRGARGHGARAAVRREQLRPLGRDAGALPRVRRAGLERDDGIRRPALARAFPLRGPRRVRVGGAVLSLRRRSLGGRLARDRSLRRGRRVHRLSRLPPARLRAFNSRC